MKTPIMIITKEEKDEAVDTGVQVSLDNLNDIAVTLFQLSLDNQDVKAMIITVAAELVQLELANKQKQVQANAKRLLS